MMFLYSVVIIIFLVLLHIIVNYNQRARLFRKIPGPRIYFIIGNVLTLCRSRVEIMKLSKELCNTWKGICRFWMIIVGSVVIYNPEDIEIILSNTKHNDKSFLYSTILSPWLNDGLLLSNGEKWKVRRKILTPSFHWTILRQFSVIIEKNAHRLVNTLKQNIGKPIDVSPAISEFTMNSICETAMGVPFDEKLTEASKEYKAAMHELVEGFILRFSRPYLLLSTVFNMTYFGKQQNKALKVVHNFTENLINQRKTYIDENGFNLPDVIAEDDTPLKNNKIAMLDLLILAEKKGLIDKAGIKEEVDTFTFEGHDTTGAALIFMLMLLANHKDVQDKIVTELKEILGDRSTRRVKMDDLNKLKYLECCIKESLRMYPPVHYINRSINEQVTLSNYTIPAGFLCHILIYQLHHQEDLFPEPEKFDPDRFLPENSVGRHPYSYIPFSAGSRNCIGQKFAMMEMKIVVAEVLREFELVPVTTPSDIEFIADLVLRHNGPVEVQFNRRHGNGELK